MYDCVKCLSCDFAAYIENTLLKFLTVRIFNTYSRRFTMEQVLVCAVESVGKNHSKIHLREILSCVGYDVVFFVVLFANVSENIADSIFQVVQEFLGLPCHHLQYFKNVL